MIRTILIYGAILAAAAVGLQWIEYRVWARAHPDTVYLGLLASAFLGSGSGWARAWPARALSHRV